MRITRNILAALVAAFAGVSNTASSQAKPAVKSLDIYIADTEGGKATLYVSPSGETVLIDTGNPGARDLDRILAMFASAGVTKVDYLISTHYHTDHVGGMAEFVKRIPVAHFMDHGPNVEPRDQVAGFAETYAGLYANAKHTVLKPGDRVPVKGLDWRIVTSAGKAITTPLTGGGQANAATCAETQRKPDPASPDDNGQSVGSVITFGRFRAIDLGDLLWNNELDLVCPKNQVGTVDLYMVTHHGLDQSGSPALVHSVRPRVAVMQNGTRKGGAPTSFETIRRSPGLEDIWTIHWSYAGGVEHNSAGMFIANVDSLPQIAKILTQGRAGGAGNPTHSPAYGIKISAQENGTFTVTNARNGFSKTYVKR
ncbi:MAG: MBL fold metallo-hydrolase [Gemmatimonadota bacterium]